VWWWGDVIVNEVLLGQFVHSYRKNCKAAWSITVRECNDVNNIDVELFFDALDETTLGSKDTGSWCNTLKALEDINIFDITSALCLTLLLPMMICLPSKVINILMMLNLKVCCISNDWMHAYMFPQFLTSSA